MNNEEKINMKLFDEDTPCPSICPMTDSCISKKSNCDYWKYLPKDLFLARDEIIDCLDDMDFVTDPSGGMMDHSICGRLENTLALLDSFREKLGIPDRAHDSVAPDQV
jgi:hypothetical protein